MKRFIQGASILLLLALNGNFVYGEGIVDKNVRKATENLANTGKSLKFIFTKSKKAEKIIKDALAKIEEDCCEENFEAQNEIDNIKNDFLKCLDEKCHKYNLPIYNPKKPPLKVVVLNHIDALEEYLIENQKFKYENLLMKEKDASRYEKIKNEQDILVVKKALNEMENENEKLKNTVDKMLTEYQKKIIKLEKDNEILEKKFEKAYNLLPKHKKKEFDKEN